MGALRRSRPAAFVASLLLAGIASAPVHAGAIPASPIARICDLIAINADNSRLPRAFLARLIWKESRFDPAAVSPKGAEGIAQFMPGTAEMRGLDDPFDIEQAIPKSAAYLAELEGKFGNLGLAAAAYNSGEARVTRWLRQGGFLPLETENYVLDVTGAPAETAKPVETPPLHPDKPFAAACRELPASRFETVAMASGPVLPWGIQVAGSFNRAAAIRRWQTIKAANRELLGNVEPVISRTRQPIGRRGIHAVRIGAESREEADRLCVALRRADGACVVTRNR